MGVSRDALLGDPAWNLSENLAKLWAGMSLTIPGMTWIYNGDEIGMFGTLADNPAGDGTGHEDRWYRQPMKWTTDLKGSRYNCQYPIGFNNYTMTWDALNTQLHGAAEQSKEQGSIYNVYKSLIKIRKENPVFARGKVVNHYTTGSVICYSVQNAESEVLVYVNASKADALTNYAVPSGATLLYGSGMTGTSSNRVPAYSMLIYKVK